MPRLKTVIAEVGTTGDVRRFDLSYAIDGAVFRTAGRHSLAPIAAHALAARVDIAEAVELEHDCDNSSCDICLANFLGFPYCAAYLLNGATETPLLDAVCYAYGFNPSSTYDKIPQWDEWVEEFKRVTVECSSCGAFNYDSETCGNCLAQLPTSERNDDNDL